MAKSVEGFCARFGIQKEGPVYSPWVQGVVSYRFSVLWNLFHDYYQGTFNSLDLHDKQWYRFHYRYGLRQWRAKMCLCIWMEAVTNSRSLINEFVKMTHLDIREAIAQGLLNLKEQDLQ